MERRQVAPWPGAISEALLVLVATAAVYVNTLGVPPYLDDSWQIDTPLTRDLGAAFAGLLRPRGLSLFTFALNHQLAGLDLRWLHLTNVLIHSGAALLVLACLRRVFPGERLLALFGALVFAVHPLQTQAVTYLVQRMTSLSGLCVFGALLLFVRARAALDAGGTAWSPRHALQYGGALLLAAAALQSKQNAAVLPGLLLLFGAFFLPREGWPASRIALYLAPFAAIPLLLGGATLLGRIAGGQATIEAAAVGRVFGDEQVSPLRYFATEWGVIWTYLRLLVLPVGQALLYDTPLVASPLAPGPVLHLSGLAALVWLGARLRRRWPTLLFGLLWFLVALLVESSFIPLDPAFEHRLYVPMFGFACAAAGALRFVPQSRARWAVAGAAVVALGGAAIRRNALWNDPAAFLEQNLSRAPGSPRLYAMLARAYRQRGLGAKAEALLEGAVAEHGLDPQLAAELAALLVEEGRLDEAGKITDAAIAQAPNDPDLWAIEGRLRERRGDREGAIGALERAAALEPFPAALHVQIGLLQAASGRYAVAEGRFRAALRASPSLAAAHYNLGVALLAQDRPAEARDELLAAARLDRADPRPIFNAAVASLRLRDVTSAEALLPELDRRSATDAAELRERIRAAR